MQDQYLVIMAITAAFLHSLIPSHWLCFSLIARKFRWGVRRLMSLIMLANLVHTMVLILFVLVVRWAVPEEIAETLSCGLILLLGASYLVMHLLKFGHKHGHEDSAVEKYSVAVLFLSLASSPCNYVIGMILSASSIPIPNIAALMLALFVVSTLTMMLLAYLGLAGLRAISLEWFDRNEKGIMGVIMVLIALFMYMHGHE